MPEPGRMYWWRARGTLGWHFGYCTYVSGGLIRMGRWNGDTDGGSVLLPSEIEYKDY